MAGETIIIFTKIPQAGVTKTRLIPYLNGRECALLHCAILTDIFGQLQILCQHRPDTGIAVYYTGCADRTAFLTQYYAGLRMLFDILDEENDKISQLQAFIEHQLSFVPQTGNDLGERMHNALAEVLKESVKAVLVGTDCPQLGADDFSIALRALDNHDLTIGGSADGGYYLIGFKYAYRALFENIVWSSNSVYNASICKARKRGLMVAELPSYTDIDYYEDIVKLLASNSGRLRISAPLTLKYLRYLCSDKRCD